MQSYGVSLNAMLYESPTNLPFSAEKGQKEIKSDYHYAPTCFLLISDGAMPITCLKARLKLAGELNPVS